MKILTKEEEEAHYDATLKGGITGGLIGLTAGAGIVFASHKRFPTFRQLTIPLKAFLVTSSGTFSAIIMADRASRAYQASTHPESFYKDSSSLAIESTQASLSSLQRAKEWGRENRYPIVTASWVASMGIAFGLVSRNKYLTGAQKLVQARVYAQGLTLAVLVATAMFETSDAKKGKGRWESVMVLDPNDPEHKHMIEKRVHHEAYQGEDLWRDMVAAEERKIEARKNAVKAEEASHKSSKPASGKSV
ncbi:hypothetical protein HYFRA_00003380 [Hymenoscyphus fraxineus]|uniref:HIG1 domain-containing protein n=1 Tax=Hymenoscyphus fraxineus TaxID=746836 RepID=A0A9N9PRK1_9HELO|nr:hypothetical protein HYFRA_00003380 [Hymenoscyphus fraxineus]